MSKDCELKELTGVIYLLKMSLLDQKIYETLLFLPIRKNSLFDS